MAVDTHVSTASLRGSRSPLEALCAKHTAGRRIVFAPQTVAEARYGALVAGWGPRRVRELAHSISEVAVLEVEGATTETAAQLRTNVG